MWWDILRRDRALLSFWISQKHMTHTARASNNKEFFQIKYNAKFLPCKELEEAAEACCSEYKCSM